jgi:hypothetical protein
VGVLRRGGGGGGGCLGGIQILFIGFQYYVVHLSTYLHQMRNYDSH